ncbi:MAG: methyltransferase domain-containing protein [Nitrospinota bacterium]|nr:methyltransferase domain-containing protein [Nitrospinota bacterium]
MGAFSFDAGRKMGFYEKFLFPLGMDWIMGGENFREERERALASAFGEVLELGFGTGLNLPHYPEAVEALFMVDPVVLLPRRVERRIAAVDIPVSRHALSAEKLPFESNRFECVVSTWTLRTIPDLAGALGETARVLKSEGKFIFLEHGRSEDERIARWQDRLNPLLRAFGCGCNMNRRIDEFIFDAGFKILNLDRFRMPKTPRLQREMYRGVARAAK